MIPLGFSTIIHLFIIIFKKLYDFLSNIYFAIRKTIKKKSVSRLLTIFIIVLVLTFIISNMLIIIAFLINKDYSNFTLIKLFF